MTKKLVFLLEELSAKELLNGILPKILPPEISFQCIPFEGRSDLEKNIPIKIKGWREPHVKFVILRDQDSGSCKTIRDKLKGMANDAGRDNTLVRIACRELESWYPADFAAVEQALNISGISKKQRMAKFRSPDKLGYPLTELTKITEGFYQKVSGSKAIASVLDLNNTRSNSFRVFIEGVKRIAV